MGPSDFDAAMKDFEKKFKDKSGHKWEDRNEEPKKGKNRVFSVADQSV